MFGSYVIMSRKVPESIRKEALSHDFQATIRVGKSGITETLVLEIDSQLTSKGIVKIKLNRGLFEKKDIPGVWDYLSQETNSILVLARGNVGVLWR